MAPKGRLQIASSIGMARLLKVVQDSFILDHECSKITALDILKPLEAYWIIASDQKDAFDDKKRSWMKMGYSRKDLEEHICFKIADSKDTRLVIESGTMSTLPSRQPRDVIGSSSEGVYLDKHADTCLLFPDELCPRLLRLFLFKVMYGKVHYVGSESENRLKPSLTADCHMRAQHSSKSVYANGSCSYIEDRSKIFIYDRDENGQLLPEPRQILPWALVLYVNTKFSESYQQSCLRLFRSWLLHYRLGKATALTAPAGQVQGGSILDGHPQGSDSYWQAESDARRGVAGTSRAAMWNTEPASISGDSSYHYWNGESAFDGSSAETEGTAASGEVADVTTAPYEGVVIPSTWASSQSSMGQSLYSASGDRLPTYGGDMDICRTDEEDSETDCSDTDERAMELCNTDEEDTAPAQDARDCVEASCEESSTELKESCKILLFTEPSGLCSRDFEACSPAEEEEEEKKENVLEESPVPGSRRSISAGHIAPSHSLPQMYCSNTRLVMSSCSDDMDICYSDSDDNQLTEAHSDTRLGDGGSAAVAPDSSFMRGLNRRSVRACEEATVASSSSASSTSCTVSRSQSKDKLVQSPSGDEPVGDVPSADSLVLHFVSEDLSFNSDDGANLRPLSREHDLRTTDSFLRDDCVSIDEPVSRNDTTEYWPILLQRRKRPTTMTLSQRFMPPNCSLSAPVAVDPHKAGLVAKAKIALSRHMQILRLQRPSAASSEMPARDAAGCEPGAARESEKRSNEMLPLDVGQRLDGDECLKAERKFGAEQCSGLEQRPEVDQRYGLDDCPKPEQQRKTGQLLSVEGQTKPEQQLVAGKRLRTDERQRKVDHCAAVFSRVQRRLYDEYHRMGDGMQQQPHRPELQYRQHPRPSSRNPRSQQPRGQQEFTRLQQQTPQQQQYSISSDCECIGKSMPLGRRQVHSVRCRLAFHGRSLLRGIAPPLPVLIPVERKGNGCLVTDPRAADRARLQATAATDDASPARPVQGREAGDAPGATVDNSAVSAFDKAVTAMREGAAASASPRDPRLTSLGSRGDHRLRRI